MFFDEVHDDPITNDLVSRIGIVEEHQTTDDDLFPVFATNHPNQIQNDHQSTENQLNGQQIRGVAEQSSEPRMRVRLRVCSVAQMLNSEKVLLMIGRQLHHAASGVGVALR